MLLKNRIGEFVVFAIVFLVILTVASRNMQPLSHGPVGGAPAMSGFGPGMDMGQGARGRITQIGRSSVTIESRMGGLKTFKISPSTRIMVDGLDANTSSLFAGHFAAIASVDGVTATSIYSRSHMWHHFGPWGPGGYRGDGRPWAPGDHGMPPGPPYHGELGPDGRPWRPGDPTGRPDPWGPRGYRPGQQALQPGERWDPTRPHGPVDGHPGAPQAAGMHHHRASESATSAATL